MRFKLVRKRINEVVDTVEIRDKKEASQYFQLKKQLDKDSFYRLYEVNKDDGN